MRLLRIFIETIRHYRQGKGNPWRLILVWYFLLNTIAFTIGCGAIFSSAKLIETGWLVNQILAALILLVVALLGQIITFIYPFIFIHALWMCSSNIKSKSLGNIVGFFSFPFLLVHFILGWMYFVGSAMMIYNAWELVKQWGQI